MNIYELKDSKLEEHAHDTGMNRRMLLDWHLVVASLATVALLNWSTSAEASDRSMPKSQGKVIATCHYTSFGYGARQIMLPSARKVRTVALAQGAVNVGNDSLATPDQGLRR